MPDFSGAPNLHGKEHSFLFAISVPYMLTYLLKVVEVGSRSQISLKDLGVLQKKITIRTLCLAGWAFCLSLAYV
jgi:hypothetical protein